jgi:arsenate reductase (thioredoxin)
VLRVGAVITGLSIADHMSALTVPIIALHRRIRRQKMGAGNMRDSYNVLFLCTGNSARSIMAEAILNKIGAGKFRAFSAGSQPKGRVHPETRQLLERLGHDTSVFRSKSWSEFAEPGAPIMDFVFTVCDNAAGETCPLWPGQPMTAHWGVPDPAEAKGNPAEIALAFKDAYRMLNQRIGIFVALPIHSLDKLSLQNQVNEIGRMKDAAADQV